MNCDEGESRNEGQVPGRVGALSAGRRDLLLRVLGQEAVDPARIPIQPCRPRPASLPLTRAQAAMWVVSQMAPGGVYNLPAAVRLRGPLEVAALRSAVAAIVARHEILRTAFPGRPAQSGGPVQVVHPPAAVQIPVVACAAEQIAARAEDVARRDFDLASLPLFRLVLYRIAPDDHVLLSVWHHLIWDGWSIGVFTAELAALYDAARSGAPPPLPPLPLQYADVALWERAWLSDAVLSARVGWWLERLAAHAPAALPADRPRPPVQSFAGALHFVDWPAGRVRRLQAFCAEAGATPYMTLLACFAILLARWSGQERLTIGTPAANRQRPELAGLIGYFANILPLPVDCSGEPSFRGLVARVRELTGAAFARQDVPFETLVERSGVARDPARNPLFQVMFALHAESLDDLRLSGLTLSPFPLGTTTTHFDLGLHLWRRGDRLGGYLSYASDLYEPATIARLLRQLEILLDDALGRPDLPISALELLDPAERDWLSSRGGADAPSAQPTAPVESGHYPTGRACYSYRPPEIGAEAAIDGRPLLRIAILDAQGRLQPTGAPGRIHVEGVATRDQGRWRADGTLEVLGPLDRTDWVGGERIVLADLEDELRRMPAVADARLAVRADGAWVAWVVARDTLDPARVEARLAQIKPSVTAVLVDRLPLDAEGGVDEAALAGLQVIDARLAARWQAALLASPGISGARVVARPREQPESLLHAARLVADCAARPAGGSVPTVPASKPARPARPAEPERLAFADGGPLRLPAEAPRTLTDALLRVADGPIGAVRGLTLIDTWGRSRSMSYAELLAAARRVLTGLRAAGLRPGDRVVLQLGSLADHFALFWGCVLGGMLPVCVARPTVYERRGSVLNKLFNTWRALHEPPIVTSAGALADLRTAARLYDAEPRLLTAEMLLASAPARELARPRPGDVVFLQLTSGSTGRPKCIQETHDGIVHHIHGSVRACAYGPDDVTVNWLPMDHVVPILTFHLKDTYLGAQQVHSRPEVVLADPLRWLDLLATHRATHTWAPNFGFQLVNAALAEADAAAAGRSWDLSRMRAFMNAGEQVTLPVCRTFVRRLAPFGVRPQALQPAFGMAEVCTCMTYANDFTPETGALEVTKDSLHGRLQAGAGVSFVDLGPPMPGVQIRIVDSEHRPLPERTIGRLQIRGRVVTPGYLDNDAANAEAFAGDGWLDSGDLGFINAGRLSVTGRTKEMIVLRGANFYCHEIEAVVHEDPGVLPGHAAACAVDAGPDGSEGLAIFCVPREDLDAAGQVGLVRRISEAITREIGVRPAVVLPLPPDAFPRTTSGKVQRTRLRERLAAGDFDAQRQALDLALGNAGTVPDWFFREVWRPRRLVGAARQPERVAVLDDTLALPMNTVPADTAEVIVDPRPMRADDPGEVLSLLQRLGAMDRPLRLLLVTRGALAVAPGEAAPRAWLRGLLKSAAQEWPKLQVRLVDIGDAADSTAVIRAELAGHEPEVALRAGRRLVPRLGRSAWHDAGTGPFAPGQAVLVTGALGGMGVAICRLLLERYRCSLLLVGRTDPHAPAPAAADPGAGAGLGLAQAVSERRAALAALQSLGEVMYVAADVADGAAMAAAVAAARERFGRPLDGALHLAGTFPARLLAEETPETLRATLRPKLDGARVVDGLLGPDAFLVLAGSVYGTFGGVAAGAYAAACSALQGLALERRGRAASTWCLAFSNWDEVGMSRGYAYRERSQALGYRMIERNRGLLSLRAALALADPFVLIGLDAARPNVRRLLTGAPEPALELVGVYTGDGDPLAVEVADAFGRPSRCDLRRVDALDGGDGAVAGLAAAGPLLPRNQMERTIAACWRDVLALTEIDIDRTFFELGGQSLQLVQVVGRLQTTLGREIGVVEMFRYPTVRTLARHLAAHGEPAGRRFEHAAARAEKQRQALRRPRPGRRR